MSGCLAAVGQKQSIIAAVQPTRKPIGRSGFSRVFLSSTMGTASTVGAVRTISYFTA
jgi:hypothetical protein